MPAKDHLDLRYPVQAAIEKRVHDEPDDVQRQIVEVQTHDAFPLVVAVDLRVEAYAPREEVDPSYDRARGEQRLRPLDRHPHERLREAGKFKSFIRILYMYILCKRNRDIER